MKLKVVDAPAERVKAKLLVLIKKDSSKKVDIDKSKSLSERVIDIFVKDFSPEELRKAGAKAVRFAKELKIDEITIAVPKLDNYVIGGQALAEGVILSSYEFDKFKTKKEDIEIKEVTFATTSPLKFKKGMEVGQIISKYVCCARDLVNNPSNHATPSALASKIKEISKKNKIKIRIYGEKEIERMGMGCFLGVAQGSSKEPKLVVLEYWGNKKSKEFHALVGKGVTFDSGGISLKPSEKMSEMKGDMAGGAAVACGINAIAELKLPVNVIGVIPCVENMPGGNAMKPGDILTSMSGKTVEVINTDAEGRLALADAIYFISKKKPKAIIDIATLTGACIVALGYHVAGLMGNNEELIKSIFKAGEKTNERVWNLPLYKEYSKVIKSDIADIKNIGYEGGAAGSLTAAAFLKEFVGKTPWAHIDMAGTFWSKEDKDYVKKGATGWGVRLFVEFFKSLT
ncbi:MAG: leucyl aminopeptidase [Nanoarchaeota archaeon]|nr:leucyl aminopeptidase [Nanoarchaeota archaeon]